VFVTPLVASDAGKASDPAPDPEPAPVSEEQPDPVLEGAIDHF